MRLRGGTFFLMVCAAFGQRMVIQTSTILDGKGGVVKDARIVVDGSHIVRVGPGSGVADVDLRGLTVMPGWIDTHIHLNWHMDENNKSVANSQNLADNALYAAGDGWMTLQGGFTTVQSVGAAIDGIVRDRIAQGLIPGPRVLTSLRQIQAQSGDAAALRALVRKTKDEGADVIKLFATSGLGAGGGQTMTDEQIQAVCGEAKAVGLRSVVHAIGDSGARASVMAGCTSVEHGTFVTD
jgi:imidazolonepropionase-like amidohydrolase